MPGKKKNRGGQNILFIFSALFLKNKDYSTNSCPLVLPFLTAGMPSFIQTGAG